jgi:hypothetical protein
MVRARHPKHHNSFVALKIEVDRIHRAKLAELGRLHCGA